MLGNGAILGCNFVVEVTGLGDTKVTTVAGLI